MSEKRNLGRGLGDLMQEVSDVQAVPAQPAAQVDEPAANTSPSDEAPTAIGHPEIVEERPPDEVINSRQPAAAGEENMNTMNVKQPFLPLWAKAAVAVLALIVAVLVFVLMQTREDLRKSRSEVQAITTDLKQARDALNADPLSWVADIRIAGLHVERFDKNARIVFDAPFFSNDGKWAPTAYAQLGSLLKSIAPHAGDCYLTVVGHTARQALPPRSPYKDNYELGLRRAQLVVDELVRVVKWPVSGISARSDGDKYPPYPGSDMLSQVRNRTITIEIRAR